MNRSLLAASITALCLSFGGVAAIAAETAAEANANADAKLIRKQADVDYKAAKENCNTMESDAKNVCLKEAKATFEKARADAHAAKELGGATTTEERSEILSDNIEDKADADRKARK